MKRLARINITEKTAMWSEYAAACPRSQKSENVGMHLEAQILARLGIPKWAVSSWLLQSTDISAIMQAQRATGLLFKVGLLIY